MENRNPHMLLATDARYVEEVQDPDRQRIAEGFPPSMETRSQTLGPDHSSQGPKRAMSKLVQTCSAFAAHFVKGQSVTSSENAPWQPSSNFIGQFTGSSIGSNFLDNVNYKEDRG